MQKPAEKEMYVIDIDYFKRVNDIYSHPIGDMLLKEIDSIIEKNLKKEQVVGRYGGEEFLIVLPDTDIEEAFNIFESVRKEVETKNFNEIDIKITISVGITSWNGNNIEDFIRSVFFILN